MGKEKVVQTVLMATRLSFIPRFRHAREERVNMVGGLRLVCRENEEMEFVGSLLLTCHPGCGFGNSPRQGLRPGQNAHTATLAGTIQLEETLALTLPSPPRRGRNIGSLQTHAPFGESASRTASAVLTAKCGSKMATVLGVTASFRLSAN